MSINIPKTMSAAVLSEYNKIEWQQVTTPLMKNDEVLVKVSYASICGSDQHIFAGEFHPPHVSRFNNHSLK